MHASGVGAGGPPLTRSVGSSATGVSLTPGKESQPAPSLRWNQMSLFHGAVFVGYATVACTQPLTLTAILRGKLPTCVDDTLGWVRMAVPGGSQLPCA